MKKPKKKKFNLRKHLEKKKKYAAFLEKRSEMQFKTAMEKDRD